MLQGCNVPRRQGLRKCIYWPSSFAVGCRFHERGNCGGVFGSGRQAFHRGSRRSSSRRRGPQAGSRKATEGRAGGSERGCLDVFAVCYILPHTSSGSLTDWRRRNRTTHICVSMISIIMFYCALVKARFAVETCFLGCCGWRRCPEQCAVGKHTGGWHGQYGWMSSRNSRG